MCRRVHLSVRSRDVCKRLIASATSETAPAKEGVALSEASAGLCWANVGVRRRSGATSASGRIQRTRFALADNFGVCVVRTWPPKATPLGSLTSSAACAWCRALSPLPNRVGNKSESARNGGANMMADGGIKGPKNQKKREKKVLLAFRPHFDRHLQGGNGMESSGTQLECNGPHSGSFLSSCTPRNSWWQFSGSKAKRGAAIVYRCGERNADHPRNT